ncbi:MULTISPECIES: hypothetical protein [Streptomyces]|uniref:Uncharacterized protein n=1 Tax=Streptomyces yangpuensis TaxID=1648182 RepID=A0ABY5Q8Z6_9ACTN|nr:MULTISPECIES: hypothetical protein [Streptomyces]MBZ9599550.1 hypothetical protein [Streptomyces erythrochromogenes]UUY52652.1 hypothetical protein NRK68_35980 [Streptomyces yangpuensis]
MLEHENQEVELRFSSAAFEDFLHTMRRIQVEFERGLGPESGRPATAAAGERSGGFARV